MNIFNIKIRNKLFQGITTQLQNSIFIHFSAHHQKNHIIKVYHTTAQQDHFAPFTIYSWQIKRGKPFLYIFHFTFHFLHLTILNPHHQSPQNKPSPYFLFHL
jgi:hypothetical protein